MAQARYIKPGQNLQKQLAEGIGELGSRVSDAEEKESTQVNFIFTRPFSSRAFASLVWGK